MSLDALIKIKGIKRYKIPLPKKEWQMVEDTDNENEDDDDNDDEF